MKAYLYLRVSTPRQAERGVSISRGDDQGVQEESCRALCAFKKWEIAAPPFIDAGITGRSSGLKRRSALTKAMQAACESQGVLVFYTLARFGRSVRDLYNLTHTLEQSGAHFATACEEIDTSTAMGRAFFGLCAVFAQLESDQISERVKAARSHLTKKLGFSPFGKQPYGWKVINGVLTPLEDEQAVRSRILAYKASVKNPAICRALNAEGIPSPGGGRWRPEAVRRVRTRKAPAGSTPR